MTENSPLSATGNSPLYAAADRAQLTAVCRADLALLEHLDRLSESRRCSARTASRRSTPSCACSSGRPNLPYTHVACMVCERYDEAYWRCASEENKHRGMHCAAHAARFHSVAPSTLNCCDPPYHPAHDYVWRAAAPTAWPRSRSSSWPGSCRSSRTPPPRPPRTRSRAPRELFISYLNG